MTNPTPKHREIGDSVQVTDENIYTMQTSNRSCVTPQYPSGSYINSISEYKYQVAKVTHTFKPGYDMTICFPDGRHFHVKYNWVTDFTPFEPDQEFEESYPEFNRGIFAYNDFGYINPFIKQVYKAWVLSNNQ